MNDAKVLEAADKMVALLHFLNESGVHALEIQRRDPDTPYQSVSNALTSTLELLAPGHSGTLYDWVMDSRLTAAEAMKLLAEDHSIPCAPSDATWFVSLVVGTTFCPETKAGGVCEQHDAADVMDPWSGPTGHDHDYGTDTDTMDGYFKGARPDEDVIREMIAGRAGWYLCEVSIKRCPEAGDESQCRWCSDDIVFAAGGDTRWCCTTNEDAGDQCGANPEDDRHEPVDEYNEEQS